MALSNEQYVYSTLYVPGQLLWCETWVWLPNKFVRISFEPSIKALLLLLLLCVSVVRHTQQQRFNRGFKTLFLLLCVSVVRQLQKWGVD